MTGFTLTPTGYRQDGTPFYTPQSVDRHNRERIDEVTGAIQNLVDSENWQANGGDAGKIHTVGTTLFIDAPPDMHEGVLWVLQSLRQDVDRARAVAERANDDAERARLEAQRIRHAEAEDERREHEMRIDREAAELEDQYDDITSRLVALAEEETQLNRRYAEAQRDGFTDSGAPNEEWDERRAQVEAGLLRLEIERDTLQARLVRTRDLLLDRQFQRYAAVGTPAAAPQAIGGAPSPAGGEIASPAAPSGR